MYVKHPASDEMIVTIFLGPSWLQNARETIPECGKELWDEHQISLCIFVFPLAVRRMF